MPVIQGGRWQRLLQKWFGIKGEVVASELAPEIYATYDVTAVPIEARILEGWHSYAAPFVQGASVGNLSAVTVFNPLSSGVIAVIERWHVLDLTGTEPYCELQIDGILAGSGNGTIRDPRMQATTGGSVIQVAVSTPAALSGTRLAYVPLDAVAGANAAYLPVRGDGKDELVLTPGHSYTVFSAAANEQIRGAVWWRERALESPEVTA